LITLHLPAVRADPGNRNEPGIFPQSISIIVHTGQYCYGIGLRDCTLFRLIVMWQRFMADYRPGIVRIRISYKQDPILG
jgi:hypothetical protein